MSEESTVHGLQVFQNQEQGIAVLDKLVNVAHTSAVFGEPLTVGERTIITAADVSVGMGFGFGGGANPAQQQAAGAGEPQSPGMHYIAGGGGGGGGGAAGRPVAVISIGPEGVRIDPVLDQTRISLALLATLGGLFVLLGQVTKARRRG